jgi:predicted ATPase
VVTNEQLYIALGIPLLFNATLVGVLIAYVNAKFQGMEAKLEVRFDAIDQRFDDMRELWRAELHRVEEILDARLKHIEDRR